MIDTITLDRAIWERKDADIRRVTEQRDKAVERERLALQAVTNLSAEREQLHKDTLDMRAAKSSLITARKQIDRDLEKIEAHRNIVDTLTACQNAHGWIIGQLAWSTKTQQITERQISQIRHKLDGLQKRCRKSIAADQRAHRDD